jgi:hypothetical protein
MPRTGWTPSIVPNGEVQTVYLVVDCFGALGVAYRETDDGPRNHHHRSDVRAIQRPGPRRRLQHRRALGAGCFERYCPRNPNPQRYRWSSAARHAAGETTTKMLAQAAGDCVEAPVMIDELESKVDGWAEAEAALAAAQQMPEGTERIDALKKAGLLRLKVDERRTAIRNARQNSD